MKDNTEEIAKENRKFRGRDEGATQTFVTHRIINLPLRQEGASGFRLYSILCAVGILLF